MDIGESVSIVGSREHSVRTTTLENFPPACIEHTKNLHNESYVGVHAITHHTSLLLTTALAMEPTRGNEFRGVRAPEDMAGSERHAQRGHMRETSAAASDQAAPETLALARKALERKYVVDVDRVRRSDESTREL